MSEASRGDGRMEGQGGSRKRMGGVSWKKEEEWKKVKQPFYGVGTRKQD